ncbi:S41 family peptidase [Kamptonema cortianum]|nr:S41 family peptidase [Kamptonema cortianum]
MDNVNRTPNIYEVSMDGRAKRMTNLVGGSGTRFLTVASKSGLIAYENDGKVFTFMPGSAPTEVKIVATVDPKGSTEERIVTTDRVEDASISPDASTAIIQIRRELWSVPVKRGKGPNGADATQLTHYAGSDEQPLYAPDGKSVFFTSDRDGANLLYQMNLESKAVKQIVGGTGDVSGMSITPDGKSLAYWQASRSGGLFTVPVTGGTPKRIIDKPHGTRYAFSPDMKYVAYVQTLINSGFKPWENSTNIWVKELASGKEVNVSKLNISDNTPAWSVDGKYLYFTSSRDGGGIFAIPAQPEAFRSTEGDFKFEKPTGAVTVDFNFTDPERRIRRLSPNGNGTSQIVSDPENGDIWFINGGDLWKMNYDGDGGRAIVGGGGVRGFSFTEDNKNIGFLQSGVPKLVDIRKPNYPVSTVEFRADWTRDVAGERRAAFHEFWRVYNNSFYDEYFHRRDWRSIRDRYEPLLDSVDHRTEMAVLLNMMVGELEASHAEVSPAFGGGVSGGTPSTAHLGFTIDYSHAGPGIKIKEVPDRTPGSYEKTKLKAAEFVMTVNGKDVSADNSLWHALNGETGRDLTITVNSTPTKTGARSVTYRAMSTGQFRSALYDNRIEWRRKYVEEKSGGRLTYVHIAGMGGGNLSTFNAEMWQYVQGKEGVVIDVRENGGGNIADILLDMLERRLHMRYVWRDSDEVPGPGQLWAKPTVVMHAETSFSNAEMFPAAMKSLGLAELVGMPTPGYVIYTGGSRLIDGTGIRIPGGGVYRVDGTPTENMGEKPDHMVDIDPDQYFNNQDPQLDKAIEVLMRKLPRG